MANIKITELNGITKKASDDVLAIVDVSANETKKIAVEDLLDKNIELIAVTDTEPAECSYGEKYYNTTDKLIYTAIATDTWSEDGEEPISGILYIVYNEQASYSWNGTDLISVGGGKEDIVIDDTEPTDPDVKLWIDTGEIGSQVSEITNSYSESTGIGYSANYVNNLANEIVETGTNANGRYIKYKNGLLICTNKVHAQGININTASGSLYYNSDAVPLGNFAISFQSIPTIVTSLNSSYFGMVMLVNDVSSTLAGNVTICRTSSGYATYDINYIAIGTWK